ncbi:MAG: response regulator, partial [Thermodesulfobacteriota bacterium]|nr:response regulator [Thermodesulfobacteriota bacterium]
EADIDSGVSSQGLDPVPESYLRLTVSDTGPGMAQDVRERIFDSYFTTKEENGTGLGLPIVQGIVTSHGGEILVFSEEGKGTSFEVLLPRTASEVTARKDQLTILPAGSERILVVDDEKAVVDVWLYMLNEFGYEVVTNTSSLEALNVFQTQPDNFDIVITDHTMPDMTGVELTREIKNIRPDIPIIMCTGCDNLITPEEAMEIGISEVVTKPIGSGLACVIRRVLDSAGRE